MLETPSMIARKPVERFGVECQLFITRFSHERQGGKKITSNHRELNRIENEKKKPNKCSNYFIRSGRLIFNLLRLARKIMMIKNKRTNERMTEKKKQTQTVETRQNKDSFKRHKAKIRHKPLGWINRFLH